MGRFGKVYACRHQGSGRPVAAKLLDLPRTLEEDCIIFDLYTEVQQPQTFQNQSIFTVILIQSEFSFHVVVGFACVS